MKIYSVKFAEESLNLFMPNTDENEQSNLSLHQQYSNILDNRSGITFDDYELKKHQIEAPYESYKSKDSVLLNITNNNYWDEEIIIKDKTESNMGILTSYNVIRDCFEDLQF